MSKVGETLTKEQTKAGWKRLTAKQQKFLDNFMYRDMTQTASAREAGTATRQLMLFGFCVTP